VVLIQIVELDIFQDILNSWQWLPSKDAVPNQTNGILSRMGCYTESKHNPRRPGFGK
jgi:hypothetical protein